MIIKIVSTSNSEKFRILIFLMRYLQRLSPDLWDVFVQLPLVRLEEIHNKKYLFASIDICPARVC